MMIIDLCAPSVAGLLYDSFIYKFGQICEWLPPEIALLLLSGLILGNTNLFSEGDHVRWEEIADTDSKIPPDRIYPAGPPIRPSSQPNIDSLIGGNDQLDERIF